MIFTEESFQKLLSRYNESGLNVVDFCSNEGIHKSTFYYWLKKSRKKEKPRAFIPLVVGERSQIPARQKAMSPDRFIAAAKSKDDDGFLELVYPNGTLLRLKKDIDIRLLKELIQLFD
ncbi:MAG: hypothetical protein ACFCUM_03310 [Bacteroidales bacterium]